MAGWDHETGYHWTNEEEYIWGFDPRTNNYEGSVFSVTYDRSTSTATFEFQLSCFLYQPSALVTPFTLRDGSTLVIERSDDLQSWSEYTTKVSLTEEGHSGNVVTISFDVTVTTAPWFYRIGVR